MTEGLSSFLAISNYMSENFAEDEESKNSLIKKGTFKEEGNEQNDLMMDDPNIVIPKDSQQAYD